MNNNQSFKLTTTNVKNAKTLARVCKKADGTLELQSRFSRRCKHSWETKKNFNKRSIHLENEIPAKLKSDFNWLKEPENAVSLVSVKRRVKTQESDECISIEELNLNSGVSERDSCSPGCESPNTQENSLTTHPDNSPYEIETIENSGILSEKYRRCIAAFDYSLKRYISEEYAKNDDNIHGNLEPSNEKRQKGRNSTCEFVVTKENTNKSLLVVKSCICFKEEAMLDAYDRHSILNLAKAPFQSNQFDSNLRSLEFYSVMDDHSQISTLISDGCKSKTLILHEIQCDSNTPEHYRQIREMEFHVNVINAEILNGQWNGMNSGEDCSLIEREGRVGFAERSMGVENSVKMLTNNIDPPGKYQVLKSMTDLHMTSSVKKPREVKLKSLGRGFSKTNTHENLLERQKDSAKRQNNDSHIFAGHKTSEEVKTVNGIIDRHTESTVNGSDLFLRHFEPRSNKMSEQSSTKTKFNIDDKINELQIPKSEHIISVSTAELNTTKREEHLNEILRGYGLKTGLGSKWKDVKSRSIDDAKKLNELTEIYIDRHCKKRSSLEQDEQLQGIEESKLLTSPLTVIGYSTKEKYSDTQNKYDSDMKNCIEVFPKHYLDLVADRGAKQFFDPSKKFNDFNIAQKPGSDIVQEFEIGRDENNVSMEQQNVKKLFDAAYGLICLANRIATMGKGSNFKPETKQPNLLKDEGIMHHVKDDKRLKDDEAFRMKADKLIKSELVRNSQNLDQSLKLAIASKCVPEHYDEIEIKLGNQIRSNRGIKEVKKTNAENLLNDATSSPITKWSNDCITLDAMSKPKKSSVGFDLAESLVVYQLKCRSESKSDRSTMKDFTSLDTFGKEQKISPNKDLLNKVVYDVNWTQKSRRKLLGRLNRDTDLRKEIQQKIALTITDCNFTSMLESQAEKIRQPSRVEPKIGNEIRVKSDFRIVHESACTPTSFKIEESPKEEREGLTNDDDYNSRFTDTNLESYKKYQSEISTDRSVPRIFAIKETSTRLEPFSSNLVTDFNDGKDGNGVRRFKSSSSDEVTTANKTMKVKYALATSTSAISIINCCGNEMKLNPEENLSTLIGIEKENASDSHKYSLSSKKYPNYKSVNTIEKQIDEKFEVPTSHIDSLPKTQAKLISKVIKKPVISELDSSRQHKLVLGSDSETYAQGLNKRISETSKVLKKSEELLLQSPEKQRSKDATVIKTVKNIRRVRSMNVAELSSPECHKPSIGLIDRKNSVIHRGSSLKSRRIPKHKEDIESKQKTTFGEISKENSTQTPVSGQIWMQECSSKDVPPKILRNARAIYTKKKSFCNEEDNPSNGQSNKGHESKSIKMTPRRERLSYSNKDTIRAMDAVHQKERLPEILPLTGSLSKLSEETQEMLQQNKLTAIKDAPVTETKTSLISGYKSENIENFWNPSLREDQPRALSPVTELNDNILKQGESSLSRKDKNESQDCLPEACKLLNSSENVTLERVQRLVENPNRVKEYHPMNDYMKAGLHLSAIENELPIVVDCMMKKDTPVPEKPVNYKNDNLPSAEMLESESSTREDVLSPSEKSMQIGLETKPGRLTECTSNVGNYVRKNGSNELRRGYLFNEDQRNSKEDNFFRKKTTVPNKSFSHEHKSVPKMQTIRKGNSLPILVMGNKIKESVDQRSVLSGNFEAPRGNEGLIPTTALSSSLSDLSKYSGEIKKFSSVAYMSEEPSSENTQIKAQNDADKMSFTRKILQMNKNDTSLKQDLSQKTPFSKDYTDLYREKREEKSQFIKKGKILEDNEHIKPKLHYERMPNEKNRKVRNNDESGEIRSEYTENERKSSIGTDSSENVSAMSDSSPTTKEAFSMLDKVRKDIMPLPQSRSQNDISVEERQNAGELTQKNTKSELRSLKYSIVADKATTTTAEDDQTASESFENEVSDRIEKSSLKSLDRSPVKKEGKPALKSKIQYPSQLRWRSKHSPMKQNIQSLSGPKIPKESSSSTEKSIDAQLIVKDSENSESTAEDDQTASESSDSTERSSLKSLDHSLAKKEGKPDLKSKMQHPAPLRRMSKHSSMKQNIQILSGPRIQKGYRRSTEKSIDPRLITKDGKNSESIAEDDKTASESFENEASSRIERSLKSLDRSHVRKKGKPAHKSKIQYPVPLRRRSKHSPMKQNIQSLSVPKISKRTIRSTEESIDPRLIADDIENSESTAEDDQTASESSEAESSGRIERSSLKSLDRSPAKKEGKPVLKLKMQHPAPYRRRSKHSPMKQNIQSLSGPKIPKGSSRSTEESIDPRLIAKDSGSTAEDDQTASESFENEGSNRIEKSALKSFERSPVKKEGKPALKSKIQYPSPLRWRSKHSPMKQNIQSLSGPKIPKGSIRSTEKSIDPRLIAKDSENSESTAEDDQTASESFENEVSSRIEKSSLKPLERSPAKKEGKPVLKLKIQHPAPYRRRSKHSPMKQNIQSLSGSKIPKGSSSSTEESIDPRLIAKDSGSTAEDDQTASESFENEGSNRIEKSALKSFERSPVKKEGKPALKSKIQYPSPLRWRSKHSPMKQNIQSLSGSKIPKGSSRSTEESIDPRLIAKDSENSESTAEDDQTASESFENEVSSRIEKSSLKSLERSPAKKEGKPAHKSKIKYPVPLRRRSKHSPMKQNIQSLSVPKTSKRTIRSTEKSIDPRLIAGDSENSESTAEDDQTASESSEAESSSRIERSSLKSLERSPAKKEEKPVLKLKMQHPAPYRRRSKHSPMKQNIQSLSGPKIPKGSSRSTEESIDPRLIAKDSENSESTAEDDQTASESFENEVSSRIEKSSLKSLERSPVKKEGKPDLKSKIQYPSPLLRRSKHSPMKQNIESLSGPKIPKGSIRSTEKSIDPRLIAKDSENSESTAEDDQTASEFSEAESSDRIERSSLKSLELSPVKKGQSALKSKIQHPAPLRWRSKHSPVKQNVRSLSGPKIPNVINYLTETSNRIYYHDIACSPRWNDCYDYYNDDCDGSSFNAEKYSPKLSYNFAGFRPQLRGKISFKSAVIDYEVFGQPQKPIIFVINPFSSFPENLIYQSALDPDCYRTAVWKIHSISDMYKPEKFLKLQVQIVNALKEKLECDTIILCGIGLGSWVVLAFMVFRPSCVKASILLNLPIIDWRRLKYSLTEKCAMEFGTEAYLRNIMKTLSKPTLKLLSAERIIDAVCQSQKRHDNSDVIQEWNNLQAKIGCWFMPGQSHSTRSNLTTLLRNLICQRTKMIREKSLFKNLQIQLCDRIPIFYLSSFQSRQVAQYNLESLHRLKNRLS
ncbi:hypothetical protein ACOME3_000174 [Neoechinorhynchus agilis]